MTNSDFGYKIQKPNYLKFNQKGVAKNNAISKTGQVIEALPSATFKVKLDEDGSEILAHLSGRMRMNFIRVLVGDKVTIEMSSYDNSKGRIVFRSR